MSMMFHSMIYLKFLQNNAYDTTTTFSSILELGAKGEDNTGKSETRKSCAMNITSKLMDYFKGKKVGEYKKISEENVVKFESEEIKAALDKVTTISEFKDWFNNVFTINGQTVHQYLTSKKYKDLDQMFMTFKGRGWISIY